MRNSCKSVVLDTCILELVHERCRWHLLMGTSALVLSLRLLMGTLALVFSLTLDHGNTCTSVVSGTCSWEYVH